MRLLCITLLALFLFASFVLSSHSDTSCNPLPDTHASGENPPVPADGRKTRTPGKLHKTLKRQNKRKREQFILPNISPNSSKAGSPDNHVKEFLEVESSPPTKEPVVEQFGIVPFELIRIEDVLKQVDIRSEYWVSGQPFAKGHFGKVFLACANGQRTLVAVKVMDLTTQSELTRSNHMQEVRLLHYLRGHPYVVRMIDAYLFYNCLNIVFEYMSQGDLSKYSHDKRTPNKNRLESRFLGAMFRQIFIVLSFLHSKNMIHRDIKPGNILLGEGVIKVGDFGLSTPPVNGPTAYTQLCGTKLFMAPERLTNNFYGVKSDIWSAGITLFFMYDNAYQNQHLMSNKEVIRKILEFKGPWSNFHRIPAEASGVVRLCLQYHANMRPSAQHLLETEHFLSTDACSDKDLSDYINTLL